MDIVLINILSVLSELSEHFDDLERATFEFRDQKVRSGQSRGLGPVLAPLSQADAVPNVRTHHK